MAIELINTGNIANDGTGDDLREAFNKVNQNFETLDIRIPEEVTAENVGTDAGQGIYKQKVSAELQFKKIKSDISGRIVVTSDADHILLDAIGGELRFITDSGTTLVNDTLADSVIRIQGYVNPDDMSHSAEVFLQPGSETIFIKANTRLKDDPNPSLSQNLNANQNNITNVNELSSNRLFGDLRGTVWGIDVRELSGGDTNWDFGGFETTYTNPIDFLLDQYSFDFGSFALPSDLRIDLGDIIPT